MTTIKNNVNHIALILDASSSMGPHAANVVRVFDNQIKHLAIRSKEMDQETRVSVYIFADAVACLIYDKDVLRLPSLAQHYKACGNTALIDGVLQAIADLRQTPEQYGDHAFLAYTLTDGEENRSRHTPDELSKTLSQLPDNWTVAAMVPDARGLFEAKRAGFSADNVSVWNTSSANAVEEAGEVIRRSTDAFMSARAQGVRGTKNLFTLNTAKVTAKAVASKLTELTPADYTLLNVRKSDAIKPFIESWKLTFRLGGAYYQLTKPEAVQNHKQICVQNKRNGKVYTGAEARKMLGLPDHEVKVSPATHPEFDLFVQSTSVNRKLIPGTKLLVMH